MIQQAKDKKKRTKDKKPRAKAKLALKFQPQPHWVEAFMVLLLAKTGGAASLHIDLLEKYGEIKGDNPTKIAYNEQTKIVTISLPEVEEPEIIVPKMRLIV